MHLKQHDHEIRVEIKKRKKGNFEDLYCIITFFFSFLTTDDFPVVYTLSIGLWKDTPFTKTDKRH